jgi:hypothetical protein
MRLTRSVARALDSPGCELWAKWMTHQARLTSRRIKRTARRMGKILAKLDRYRAWEALGISREEYIADLGTSRESGRAEIVLTPEDLEMIRAFAEEK